ncbi:capsid cement protein [Shimia sp.]|uniref:capsid cement protein n=1 Tax=Shimia sp. TaxID=1954381 RepID=UPI003B8C1BE3
MKTLISAGAVITATAAAAVASGAGVLVGSIFGVAQGAAKAGEEVDLVRCGNFELAKAAGQSWDLGDKIYWDDAAGNCTTTDTDNTLIGAASDSAATADTTGAVLLDGAIR